MKRIDSTEMYGYEIPLKSGKGKVQIVRAYSQEWNTWETDNSGNVVPFSMSPYKEMPFTKAVKAAHEYAKNN